MTRESGCSSRSPSEFVVLVAALIGFHCGPEGSIDVVFPTSGARDAVKTLRIDAYETSGVGGCADVLELAEDGESPNAVALASETLTYPLEVDAAIDVPPGRAILHVRAFDSDQTPPILEGCTDRFDSDGETSNLPVTLDFVLPSTARIVRVGGDQQVALGPGPFVLPITVAVEAVNPTGPRTTYLIPGIPFRFEIETAGFAIDDALEASVAADAEGHAAAAVTGPAPPADGRISVTAIPLDERPEVARAEFRLGVRAPPVTRMARRFEGDGARVVDAAVGDFAGTAELDLAVVGCVADTIDCTAAATTLRRIDGLVSAGRTLPPVAASLGIEPKAVSVIPVRPGERASVVVLDGRRADSQGAEVHVVDEATQQRFTTTGSNAVALLDLETGAALREIGVVTAGRVEHSRPCLGNAQVCGAFDAPSCADDPSLCGCPPGERCDCIDCDGQNNVCIAEDEGLDIIAVRAGTRDLYERGGCQAPNNVCAKDEAGVTACTCGDDRDGACVSDGLGCGCLVPARTRFDVPGTTFEPTNGKAARLVGGTRSDVLLTSKSSIGYLRRTPQGYVWHGGPTVNGAHDDALAMHLDDDDTLDIAWSARAPCTGGAGFEDNCPIVVRGGESGCLGLLRTAGAASIIDTSLGQNGACSRRSLSFVPHDMCTGDFNADGDADLALTSRSLGVVLLYIGDGKGGVSDPPAEVALPEMEGGIVRCADVDGAFGDDLVVVDASDGTVAVITSGNP